MLIDHFCILTLNILILIIPLFNIQGALPSQKTSPPKTYSQPPFSQSQSSNFFATPRLHPVQHGAPSPVAARLGHVAERFSSFYNDLESEKQQRREAEQQRRHTFQEQLSKLERNLEVSL